MVRYELWQSKEEGSLSFCREGDARGLPLHDDAVLIWTVEAEDWEEAQQKKHDFLGWGPYVPMK